MIGSANILKALDSSLYSRAFRAMALDISKDFEKVGMHAALLYKLNANGVGTLFFPSLNLFFKIGPLRLFLMVSHPCHNAEVSQGSVLGPTFFMYINDLPNDAL